MLALLPARYGLDIAADAVQDALVEALRWGEEPLNPAGWLYTVARNRAVDSLRRQSAAHRREQRAAVELFRIRPLDTAVQEAEPEVVTVVDERESGRRTAASDAPLLPPGAGTKQPECTQSAARRQVDHRGDRRRPAHT